MPENYSQLFTVQLTPHNVPVRRMSPVGPVDDVVEFDQFQVWIEGPAVRSTSKRLLVGYIGKQFEANFCPLPAFYLCVKSHQDWIVAEAKKQHGNASPDPIVDVPPPDSHKPA